jgi:hypothetical protein
MSEYIMNRESLKLHCEAMCKKFEKASTSGTYGEHRLVLDLLEQTEWIPVSERLPKSSGVYIVSRWFSDGEERAILVDANYYDGNGYWYNDNRINWGRDLVTNRIVAWMPLPEPYKAESEEQ